MKRTAMIALGALPVGLALWALAQTAQQGRTLASYAPPGALLFLETRNLATLVADWNGSEEKRLWLAGDNYQVFSRSRLYQRLEQMQQEFAAAAGVPADMPLVDALAGGETALALYDIGEMHFLYLTRLEAARAMESALWKAGSKFESRVSAGKNYFVRREPARGREAAFAAADGWALVSTREELLARALALLAGERAPSLREEAWLQNAVRGAGVAGELRMALNLPALTRTPHFRSHWIQRNITELRQYSAGLVDLQRSAREYREERRLVRAQATPPRGGALGQLLRLAPDSAGLILAWAAPPAETVVSLISRKVLAPDTALEVKGNSAPPITRIGRAPAEEGDFDTRINDAPPGDVKPELRTEALGKLIEQAKVEAALLVQSSRPGRDKLFVGFDAVVALQGTAEWPSDAVRAAIAGAVEGLYSVSGLGLEWQERKAGTESVFETGGLARVALATRGRLLLVGTSAEALAPVMARLAAPPPKDEAIYAAEYRPGRELANFTRMMRMIDHLSLPEEPPSPDSPRQPLFFSENLAGLGQTLGRVDSVSIRAREAGAVETQTVVYRLSR